MVLVVVVVVVVVLVVVEIVVAVVGSGVAFVLQTFAAFTASCKWA